MKVTIVLLVLTAFAAGFVFGASWMLFSCDDGGTATKAASLRNCDTDGFPPPPQSSAHQSPTVAAGSEVYPDRHHPLSPAYEESLGFFDDVPAGEWNMLKRKFCDMEPNTKHADPTDGDLTANFWYQENYEPNFTCRHERRIGDKGDGGKWVCDPHRLAGRSRGLGDNGEVNGESEAGGTANASPSSSPSRSPSCLVYSVGSAGDFSFESAIRAEVGPHCEIHTFDPGNFSSGAEAAGLHYHRWGISSYTHIVGRKQSDPAKHRPFRTLAQTVSELGHVNRTIDLFKIDCNGCEWNGYPTWLSAPVDLRQVLIEVHGVENPKTMDFFQRMREEGYVIFHKEPNIMWSFGKKMCVEYSFLKLGKEFFG